MRKIIFILALMFIFTIGLFSQVNQLNIYNGSTNVKTRHYANSQTDTVQLIRLDKADSVQVQFTFTDSVKVLIYVMIGNDANATNLGAVRLDSVLATGAKVVSYSWAQIISACGAPPVTSLRFKLAYASSGNAITGSYHSSAWLKEFYSRK